MEKANKTPIDDLRNNSLKHYDKASSKVHEFHSLIPQSINFYCDYRKMSLWNRIILAIKTSVEK